MDYFPSTSRANFPTALFMVLNAEVCMHNLGYKHSTDRKPHRVSWELVMPLNGTAFQVNFCRMLLKPMRLSQNEKEKQKSGSAKYLKHKMTASFKPLHITY